MNKDYETKARVALTTKSRQVCFVTKKTVRFLSSVDETKCDLLVPTCTNSELFLTVKVFFCSGDKIETRCLDTAYVALPMLLVIGLSGVSAL